MEIQALVKKGDLKSAIQIIINDNTLPNEGILLMARYNRTKMSFENGRISPDIYKQQLNILVGDILGTKGIKMTPEYRQDIKLKDDGQGKEMKKNDEKTGFIDMLKKLFSWCLYLCLLNTLQSQTNQLIPSDLLPHNHPNHVCGIQLPPIEEILQTEKEIKKIIKTTSRNVGMTAVPIKVHIIRKTDGTGGLDLTRLNEELARLNNYLFNSGIEFYICGDIDYIDDSNFYDYNSTQETALANAANEVSNALNLYIPNSIVLGSTVAGYAYLPNANNNVQTTRLFVGRPYMGVTSDGPTLIHEIGHTLNLYHTFNGTESGNTHIEAEHVPRTGANSNCDTAGDLLCDTPADPGYNSNYNQTNCTYTGTSTDVYGNTYVPDTDNIMSYYPQIDPCANPTLTPEQYTRMADGLAYRLSQTGYSLDCSPTIVNVPTNLTVIQNGNEIDVTWTDNANNETGYFIERSSTSATSGFEVLFYGGTAPDITSFIDFDAQSQTDYWYRIKPSNGDANTYSNVVHIYTDLVYCTPTNHAISCDAFGDVGAGMDDFELTQNGTNIIDNPNNGCHGGYSNYTTTISGNVLAGNTYDYRIDLDTDGSGGYVSQIISIWVDINQDGDFDDMDEDVVIDKSAPAYIITGNFQLPASTLAGITTMRVRSRFTDGNSVMACGYIAFSEAEDYRLIVTNALPVELISFDARKVEKETYLKWATASENNNSHFVIERSLDGKNFQELGVVQSLNANYSDEQHYSFTDKFPEIGKNYYRLKQVDLNSQFEYSDIQIVAFNENLSLKIFPNPSQDGTFNLEINQEEIVDFDLQLFNMNGQLLFENHYWIEDYNQIVQLSFPDLAKGIYFLKVKQNQNIQSVRLIVN